MISSLRTFVGRSAARPHARLAAPLAFAVTLGVAPLAMPSCTEDAAGIQVPVSYRGTELVGVPLATADQVSLRLQSARVALASLELRACPTTVAARAAALFRPSTARAHSTSSATQLGVPVVVAGLRADALHPGTFRPPPGRYCSVHGMLAAPDDDALGADPQEPLLGAVELRGERLNADGEAVSSFTLLSTMSVAFDLVFEEPLELGPLAPYAELALVLDPVTWAAAITLPDGPLDAEGAGALSQAAAASLSLELSRSAP